MADDFVNFDRALNELGMSAEQLKRLVSEGQIRAVRGENDTMRFRREEIERLRQQSGQDTGESSDTLTDDLLFDEADDLEVEDEGMATAQISSDDTLMGDEGKAPPPVEPAAPPAGSIPAARRTGGRSGMTSGPRVTPSSGGGSAPTSVRRTTGRSTRMRQMEQEKEGGVGIAMTAIMGLTLLICLYACLVWLDIANGGGSSSPTAGFAEQMVGTFADTALPGK